MLSYIKCSLAKIHYIWHGKSKLYFFLLPFSLLYGLISNFIGFLYRNGWCKPWRSPVPIVVVGNLTVGGNGKTPLVIWLTKQLQHAGIYVGVVSRGYGGKSNNYPLLLNSNTTALQAGDEPILIQQRTGAVVVVSPCRVDAVRKLLSTRRVDVIISDDGLQHHALARDYELVVIDGERRFGNGYWLPAGPMRESKTRLKYVNIKIVNGGKVKSGEISMKLIPKLAVNLYSGKQKIVSDLKNVIAMAGIGYPNRFFDTLDKLGVLYKKKLVFLDHQKYSFNLINSLVNSDESLLMTEKDAVKVKTFALNNWWYLPVDVHLDKGHGIINDIINIVKFYQK